MLKCSVPAEAEPKLEAWLDRRDIHFEVAPSRAGRLVVIATFDTIGDERERLRLEGMYKGLVLKIPGGKILKNKG